MNDAINIYSFPIILDYHINKKPFVVFRRRAFFSETYVCIASDHVATPSRKRFGIAIQQHIHISMSMDT